MSRSDILKRIEVIERAMVDNTASLVSLAEQLAFYERQLVALRRELEALSAALALTVELWDP